MPDNATTNEYNPIYFFRNLSVSTVTMLGLSPFLNACNFVSTRCITDETGPRAAMNAITNHWKNPRALLDGVKQTTQQQIMRSFVRNGIWFKKDALDKAFPEASKYIVPAFFAATEILLNPSMVKRTRIQAADKVLVGRGDMFLGVLPGVLKVTVTTGVYVQVKPLVDDGMHACGINSDSVLGACTSALPISVPITLFAHPLERIRTQMQLPSPSSHKLGFFEVAKDVLSQCKTLTQEQGLNHAMRFFLRGWQPALVATTGFTVAFNLMILAGKQEVEASSLLISPKALS
ncbi:MAG: MC/SLC25 family protein [Gammaproteobacteria bacterium]|nr:MC/SLC25 family protein [Gammaproteobacteria bacterium]